MKTTLYDLMTLLKCQNNELIFPQNVNITRSDAYCAVFVKIRNAHKRDKVSRAPKARQSSDVEALQMLHNIGHEYASVKCKSSNVIW